MSLWIIRSPLPFITALILSTVGFAQQNGDVYKLVDAPEGKRLTTAFKRSDRVLPPLFDDLSEGDKAVIVDEDNTSPGYVRFRFIDNKKTAARYYWQTPSEATKLYFEATTTAFNQAFEQVSKKKVLSTDKSGEH